MTDLLPLAPEIETALDEAAKALDGDEPLVVACHVGPDGDALGSILAFALAMRQLGREVQATWGSETLEVPLQYAFLPGRDTLARPAEIRDTRAVLVVDCASPERLELLQDRFLRASVLVNVDHHVSNPGFGTVDVVDTSASSSSELVLRLLLKMGVEITPDVATCLYTGLVTDAGRFSYASVTPRTHATAAYLIERGVRVDAVSQSVFESLPYGYLKILGRVLDRCRLLNDPPLVVSWMTQSDLVESQVSMDETEELINVLRSVRESDAAAVFKEMSDGRWKGSLRSKGDTDVSAIAQHFGGGGHRLAAGFTSPYGLEETITRVHDILRESRDGTTA